MQPDLFKDIETPRVGDILTQLCLPALFMASAALPHMRAQGGGTIVNVASGVAKTATPGEAVIGAANAAIVMSAVVQSADSMITCLEACTASGPLPAMTEASSSAASSASPADVMRLISPCSAHHAADRRRPVSTASMARA